MTHRLLAKTVSGLLAALLCTTSLPAQAVSAQRETASILVSKSGRPRSLHVEFGLTSPFVVSQAHLAYRQQGGTKYQEVKLRRNEVLRYVADLPVVGDIEYYFRLKPERGPDVLLGSDEEPFLLTTAQLQKEQMVASHTKIKLLMVGVVAAMLTIGFILAVEKPSKL